jgi:putative tricarboxylic transport membrane protein
MRARGADKDAMAGLALGALGAYVATRALDWDLLNEDGAGPGFFPFGYGVGILCLSAVLVLRAVLRPRPAAAAGDGDGHLRALVTWAAFAAAAGSMRWLGFVAPFAALTAFVVMFVFGRGWRSAALVAAGCAGGFWLLFQAIMGVGLPAGPWGF